jgi:hypothetical protein
MFVAAFLPNVTKRHFHGTIRTFSAAANQFGRAMLGLGRFFHSHGVGGRLA